MSLVSLPSSGGMLPVRSLAYSERIRRSARFPSSAGMLPGETVAEEDQHLGRGRGAAKGRRSTAF